MGYIEIEKDSAMGVAVVWLDQPGEKVNKLSLDILDEFKDTLDSLEQDEVIKGIVLISRKPECFIAGADLEKILALSAGEAEKLSREANRFLQRIAGFPKPIVAAINGAALGGGMEAAMACHYRIASNHPKTVLAQPEVKLGLLPAAGGTRLPRLIGLQNALPLLLTGSNVYPGKAKKLGLVDDVIHPYGLLNAAKIAAIHFAGKKRKRKTSLTEKLLEGNPLGRMVIYRAARKQVQKATGGHYPAPFKILECVKAGMEWGMKAGIEAEAKKFEELVSGKVSRELIRIFFNMNSRKKNPYEGARPLRRIGILGSGFMGAGVANVVASRQEIPVVLKDVNNDALAYAEKTIWEDLSQQVKKRALSAFERDMAMSRIFPTTEYRGFEKCDVVIEAVFEDLELKRKVLSEVEAIVREDCVFASNTSCIPISEIAREAKRPERVLGMHYFSPVPVMPLLEIIFTDKTADWALATAFQMGIEQGKTVIAVKDGPGFYTTRILSPYLHEAVALLEEGAEVEAIDGAMKKFGFPVGPITLLDEVGIDVGAHVSMIMGKYFAARGATPGDAMEKMTQAGYKGRKNKRGFYHYPGKKGKKKQVNREVYSFFGGRRRKSIPLEEIQRRLSMAMLNEAACCLKEGLRCAEDGDVGAIFGLGFPPFLGGPFRYMDSLGVAKVLTTLEDLEKKYGKKFTPAPILQEMAAKNETFYK